MKGIPRIVEWSILTGKDTTLGTTARAVKSKAKGKDSIPITYVIIANNEALLGDVLYVGNSVKQEFTINPQTSETFWVDDLSKVYVKSAATTGIWSWFAASDVNLNAYTTTSTSSSTSTSTSTSTTS